MTKPIKVFNSEEQFIDCCKYWQHKLFLDDWIIKFKMTKDKLYQDDILLHGLCEFNFDSKEAIITIFTGKYSSDESISDTIGELTIIHELLHLKNEYIQIKDIIKEEPHTFYKCTNHQSLEVMAKSLLMVKYNLDYDYFVRNLIA